MADSKTKATVVPVADFIDSVSDPDRRDDARQMTALLAALTGEEAVMWGPSIVGFGRYDYRYDSGREGSAARIGFSPRARENVLYLVGGLDRHRALLDRLGPHRTGTSCLYFKRLADLDATVLRRLVTDELAYMDNAYPRSA